MPPLVDVVCEDARWAALGLDTLAERAAGAALRRLGLGAEGFEISLLAASDARVAELNAAFRGKPVPTNVLSWPSEDRAAEAEGGTPEPPEPGPPGDPEGLGDIALAYETCAREAAEGGLSLADHTAHLVVHATLHLLGYDHEREGDAAAMEGLEIEILASLGIADPYGMAARDRIA